MLNRNIKTTSRFALSLISITSFATANDVIPTETAEITIHVAAAPEIPAPKPFYFVAPDTTKSQKLANAVRVTLKTSTTQNYANILIDLRGKIATPYNYEPLELTIPFHRFREDLSYWALPVAPQKGSRKDQQLVALDGLLQAHCRTRNNDQCMGFKLKRLIQTHQTAFRLFDGYYELAGKDITALTKDGAKAAALYLKATLHLLQKIEFKQSEKELAALEAYDYTLTQFKGQLGFYFLNAGYSDDLRKARYDILAKEIQEIRESDIPCKIRLSRLLNFTRHYEKKSTLDKIVFFNSVNLDPISLENEISHCVTYKFYEKNRDSSLLVQQLNRIKEAEKLAKAGSFHSPPKEVTTMRDGKAFYKSLVSAPTTNKAL